MPAVDYRTELIDQLDWHWTNHLRPGLDGLTDNEYFWEPVPECWSVRQRDGGVFVPDSGPIGVNEHAPFTTIAWRLCHIAGEVLGWRVAAHIEHTATSEAEHLAQVDWPGSARDAVSFTDDIYARWKTGLVACDDAGFAAPCGPAEGPFAASPFAALVLHINREVIHHGAEVMTLRALYAAQ